MRLSRLPLVSAGVVTPLALAAAATPTASAALTPDPTWHRVAALQSATAGDSGLAAAVKTTVSVPAVTNATVGVAVRDMTDGHLVYVRNGSTPIPPASTAKSRTTGAALSLLGAGYRWHTDVLARGSRTGGTLNGPLVLKGFGDPTLQQSDLASLAKQVRAAGITRVSGLLTDDTWFDGVRHHPDWHRADLTQYYAAPISALTLSPDTDLDLATAIVQYAPGTVGKPARVWTVPAAAASYLRIVNTATTSASGTGDSVWVDQPLDSGVVTVGGRVASGRSAQSVLTVTPSPQLYAGAVFRAELAKAGVTVGGSTNPGKATAADKLVARDWSTTLSSAIVPMLKQSNNMMAETILKTISAQAGGGGTWPDGARRVAAWMARAGIPMTNVRVVDGSGLSATNSETAMSESGLLWALRTNGPFYAALPVAGNPDPAVGGTLTNRLVGTAAANNLRAKTGTLNGVTALSGYVRTGDGRKLSMSMISSYRWTSPRPVENSLALTLARWNGRTTTALAAPTTSALASAATASEWPKRSR